MLFHRWLCGLLFAASFATASGCSSWESPFDPTDIDIVRVLVYGCGGGIDGQYDGLEYVPFLPGVIDCRLEMQGRQRQNVEVGLGGEQHLLQCRLVHTCQSPNGRPAPIGISVDPVESAGSCVPLIRVIRGGVELSRDECQAFFGVDDNAEVSTCFDVEKTIDVSYHVAFYDRQVTIAMNQNDLDCEAQIYCYYQSTTSRPDHDPSCR